MAILKLATYNHATFTSSIWGGLASAPYDISLVTEVNIEYFEKLKKGVIIKLFSFCLVQRPVCKLKLSCVDSYIHSVINLRME